MSTCPDCIAVEAQIKGNGNFEIIDIGEHVRNLKEFLALRDKSPFFEKVRQKGTIGIPCFILENGDITFNPAHVGLERRERPSEPKPEAPVCNIDGSGC